MLNMSNQNVTMQKEPSVEKPRLKKKRVKMNNNHEWLIRMCHSQMVTQLSQSHKLKSFPYFLKVSRRGKIVKNL